MDLRQFELKTPNSGSKIINGYTTHVYPFLLSDIYSFQIYHNYPTQDFTPYFWVSTEPRGISVIKRQPNHFNLIRGVQTFNFYNSNLKIIKEKNKINLPLLPGNYFINVVNILNINNGYFIKFLTA